MSFAVTAKGFLGRGVLCLLVGVLVAGAMCGADASAQDPPDVALSAFELSGWSADSSFTDPTNGNVVEYLSHDVYPDYLARRIKTTESVLTGAAFIGDTLVVYDDTFFPGAAVIDTGAEAFFDFVTADPGHQTLDVWWIGEQFRIARDNAEN